MKTIFKRIAGAITAFAVAVTSNVAFDIPTSFAAAADIGGNCGADGSNVKWKFDEATGKVTIYGSGMMAEKSSPGEYPWYEYEGSIKSVVIEDGVTNIPYIAFSELGMAYKNLLSVYISGSVKNIGSSAFNYARNLQELTISEGVESIGQSAFGKCSSLTSVTLPSTLTQIHLLAFQNMNSLKTVVFKGKTPPTGIRQSSINSMFEDSLNITKIYVPCTSVDTYKNAEIFKLSGKKDKITAEHGNIQHVPAQNATCTAEGNIEYWKCKDCGKFFNSSTAKTTITKSSTVINKISHKYDSGTVTEPATCTATGIKKFSCTVCGQTKTSTVAITDHSWDTAWSTDDANHWHDCTNSDCTAKNEQAEHAWDSGTVTEPATCTATGIKKFSCTVCGQTKTSTVAITDHSWDTAWSTDDANHWHDCTNSDCTAKNEQAEHAWDSGTITAPATCTATGIKKFSCTVCGQTKTEAVTETGHNLTHTEAKEATCTDSGNIEYWRCSRCGNDYSDENAENRLANTEISAIKHNWGEWTVAEAPTRTKIGTARRICLNDSSHTDTKGIPVLTDSIWSKTGQTDPDIDKKGEEVFISEEYGEVKAKIPELSDTDVWTKDDEQHIEPTEDDRGKDVYTSDIYGEVTVTIPPLDHVHTLIHVDEIPATETADGVKEHWHCNGCGKDFMDENGENEATADNLKIGKLEKEVLTGENAPALELITPDKELFSAVLTPDEQEKINEGTNIKIILQIEDGTETVPEEEKEKVEKIIGALDNCKLGQYLDVSLLKMIGGAQEKITKTNAPITVMFEIPEAIRGEGRNYSVIRVHDDKTDVLPDLDNDKNTVTIKTDKFSTYALAYSENTNITPSVNIRPVIPSSDEEIGAVSTDINTVTADSNNVTADNSAVNASSEPAEGEKSQDSEKNPSTGFAVSLIPFLASTAMLAIVSKSKRK